MPTHPMRWHFLPSRTRYVLYPGEILLSKYRVERVLGQGSMGLVATVKCIDSDQRFAIKLMLPLPSRETDSERRFMQEAQTCMLLTSEHVVRVYDVGRLEDGVLYMRMQLLDGTDLKAYSEARGAFEVAEVVQFLLQICGGIAEAHGLGIIHRDIKLANLFLTTRQDSSVCIKILDFGISKQAADDMAQPLTKTGDVVGSPAYMSPEQMIEPRMVDARTDIWSLGVVAYELLTGRKPFEARTVPLLIQQVIKTEPMPPRASRADIPEELERVVLRCLEKEREKRFATVQALSDALRNIVVPK